MTRCFKRKPFLLRCKHWSPMTRPRLWWHSQEPWLPPGPIELLHAQGAVRELDIGSAQRARLSDLLEPGVKPWDIDVNGAEEKDFHFSGLCRHTPRSAPMKDPRGLGKCDPDTLERWKLDSWAQ